jgi:hypothetical protein
MNSTPYGLPVTNPLSPRISRRAVSPAATLIGSRVGSSSPRVNVLGSQTAYFTGSTLPGVVGSVSSGTMPFSGGVQMTSGLPLAAGGIATTSVPSGPVRGESRM